MELEQSIKDCISKELENGLIERVLATKLEEAVTSAVKDMFGWNGSIKKVLEEQIKSVMIPYLEKYNYSKHITKLDSVLTEILEATTGDNKALLENFKELMIPDEQIKKIRASEIFERWKAYVADNVSTDDLEVEFDDGVRYEPVDVTMILEEERGSGNIKYASLVFKCEQDDAMEFTIKLCNFFNSKVWSISGAMSEILSPTINSLRWLDSFEIFMMKLYQNGTEIEIDKEYDDDSVSVTKEPEAEYR